MRIEDTDRERFVPDAEERIVKILNDFGLHYDERYKQSERLEIYQKYAQQLVADGKAYEEEGEKGTAIRFKLAKTGITEYSDLVYGKIQFKNELLKDPVILKSDGYPVYNFANVVDDHEMGVTHVIRGEEFLSSTPMHVQIYQAFGWQTPQFSHVPLILDAQRKKLSKRTGDVAVEEYLKKGYLKEALINFVALLGWNPKTTQEVFSLEELEKEFAIEKINKAGAIFDLTKLDFLNRQWKEKLHLKPQADPMFAYAKKTLSSQLSDSKVVDEMLIAIWPQIEERIPGPSKVEEMIGEFDFYFTEPDLSEANLVWKKSTAEDAKKNLEIISEFLSALSDDKFDAPTLEQEIKTLLEKNSIKTGDGLWPLRVALSGKDRSPSPFEIMSVLKKEKSLERIKKGIEALSKGGK